MLNPTAFHIIATIQTKTNTGDETVVSMNSIKSEN